jgi:hypothetical protein
LQNRQLTSDFRRKEVKDALAEKEAAVKSEV